MKTEEMKIAELIPYERNAKMHDERQIQNVMESIKQFGFAQPLVVDKNNVLIIGHCRLIAAKRLHKKTVPVVRMDELTPDQVDKLRLLDNKLNESEWNLELLAEDIPELDWDGFDIDWGLPELEDDAVEIIEDEAPEPPEEPKTKNGDIYQLGRHRLICGDSTDGEVIGKLMQEEHADLYLTDPPYNVDYVGKTKDALKIQNDSMEDGKFREFLRDAFQTANAVMKPGAAFYIWHADSEGYNFRGACRDIGWKIRQCIIWSKNCMVLGRQDYQWKHEPCLYGWKEGSHYFTDSRRETTVWEDEPLDFSKMKKEEMKALLEKIFKTSTTIINEKKPAASTLHPTTKPIQLLAHLIKNSSKPGQLILDSFGGSGSTLITCEQLNRTCYTAELDPKYCDVIVERWETFTGRKAEKING